MARTRVLSDSHPVGSIASEYGIPNRRGAPRGHPTSTSTIVGRTEQPWGSGLDEYAGVVNVEARGIFPGDGLFDNPHRWQLRYAFPGGPTWHWTDCAGDGFGSRAGTREAGGGDWPQHRMGITFEGTEGRVFIWRNQVEAEPEKLLRVRIGHRDGVRLRAGAGGVGARFVVVRVDSHRDGALVDVPVAPTRAMWGAGSLPASLP